MSLGSTSPLYPHVRIEILNNIPGITGRQLEERLVKFQYKHEKKQGPKIELQFDNSDGLAVNFSVLLSGLKMRLTFGYPDLQSPTLIAVARQIDGTRVNSGSINSPTPEAFGLITMFCAAHANKADRSTKDARMNFRNAKISTVVRQIAKTLGYSEDKIFVQDNLLDGSNEPIMESILVEEADTAYDFLSKTANNRGFEFFESNDEFHWHSDDWWQWNLSADELHYFYGPDILDLNVDGNFSINVQEVKIKAYSNRVRESHYLNGSVISTAIHTEPVRPGSVGEAINRPALKKIDTTATIPERVNEKGLKRLYAHARNKWKLKLKVVGDPRIFRGTVLSLFNFGFLIDGKWRAQEIIHTLDGSGLTTEATLNAFGDKIGGPSNGRIVWSDHCDIERDVWSSAPHLEYTANDKKRLKKNSRKGKGKKIAPMPTKATPLTPNSRIRGAADRVSKKRH